MLPYLQEVIFNEHFNKNEVLYLHTRSGILTAKVVDDSIELDFPADVPLPVEKATHDKRLRIRRALDIRHGPKNRLLTHSFTTRRMVKKAKPNMNLFVKSSDPPRRLPERGKQELLIISSSRFFYPLGRYSSARIP